MHYHYQNVTEHILININDVSSSSYIITKKKRRMVKLSRLLDLFSLYEIVGQFSIGPGVFQYEPFLAFEFCQFLCTFVAQF